MHMRNLIMDVLNSITDSNMDICSSIMDIRDSF